MSLKLTDPAPHRSWADPCRVLSPNPVGSQPYFPTKAEVIPTGPCHQNPMASRPHILTDTVPKSCGLTAPCPCRCWGGPCRIPASHIHGILSIPVDEGLISIGACLHVPVGAQLILFPHPCGSWINPSWIPSPHLCSWLIWLISNLWLIPRSSCPFVPVCVGFAPVESCSWVPVGSVIGIPAQIPAGPCPHIPV